MCENHQQHSFDTRTFPLSFQITNLHVEVNPRFVIIPRLPVDQTVGYRVVCAPFQLEHQVSIGFSFQGCQRPTDIVVFVGPCGCIACITLVCPSCFACAPQHPSRSSIPGNAVDPSALLDPLARNMFPPLDNPKSYLFWADTLFLMLQLFL